MLLPKRLLFLLIAVGCSALLKAQPEDRTANLRRNSLYVEVGGNNLIYSLNFDRIIAVRDRHRLSLRIGAGYIPQVYLGLPVEVNTMIGKQDNFIEAGLGLTPVLGDYSGAYSPSLMAVGRIGFRHQRAGGGQLLRVGFNMLAILYSQQPTNYRPLMPWGGISWGFTL